MFFKNCLNLMGIAFLVAVIFLRSAFAGEFIEKNWKHKPIPQSQSKQWEATNQSEKEWRVFKVNNQLFFDKNKRKKNSKERVTQINVNDGVLYGVDAGEWGGKLYWQSNSGQEKYDIATGNFKQFIKDNDDVYILEGLAHLSSSTGKIWRISAKDKWTAEEYLDLEDAPYAAVVDNSGNAYVVTSQKLLKISLKNKVVSTLYSDMFWWGMYSNSIEMMNDATLVIGMRGGIVKVSLKKNEIVWLTK